MERHRGTKALGQITGLLCLRLASVASATWQSGLSRLEREARTTNALLAEDVLPPGENFRAEPFSSGDTERSNAWRGR